jgi:hypothetical protein
MKPQITEEDSIYVRKRPSFSSAFSRTVKERRVLFLCFCGVGMELDCAFEQWEKSWSWTDLRLWKSLHACYRLPVCGNFELWQSVCWERPSSPLKGEWENCVRSCGHLSPTRRQDMSK